MTALVGIVALQAEVLPLIGQDKAVTSGTSTVVISELLRQRLARAAAVGYRLDKFLHLG
jgi:hypothetical protein